MPHPIFVGFFIALWTTPNMKTGRFILAVIVSAFIIVDLRLATRGIKPEQDDELRPGPIVSMASGFSILYHQTGLPHFAVLNLRKKSAR